jgi:hypothetical protein
MDQEDPEAALVALIEKLDELEAIALWSDGNPKRQKQVADLQMREFARELLEMEAV